MKSRIFTCITAMALFAALAIPVRHTAQEQPAVQRGNVEHTRYRLVDLGTFGGPNSTVFFADDIYDSALNNQGTVAGSADTSAPDPFPLFCFNGDCFVSHAFQRRNGVMTDLGVLPGGASSASAWISANGLIVGWSENGLIDPLFPGFPELRAVLWKNGEIKDLGTLEGGNESVASAVNSLGQVVGAAANAIPDPSPMGASNFGWTTETRAFLWQDGIMQDLGTLGGPDAVALLMNERGQIAGDSYTSFASSLYCAQIGFPLTTGAFLWENGQMVDLGSFGGTCTFAFDLNNRGQVVGASTLTGDLAQHPFLWDRGALADLGTFGGNFGNAIANNDAGDVVGWASLQGDQAKHAFLWKDGAKTDLGTVAGDLCSYGFSVNSKGQVVGVSAGTCPFEAIRPFLWEDGGPMVDLNTLIPPDSGLHLEAAETINDRGEIAGNGVDPDGNQHAFLLIPCSADDTACQDAAAGTSTESVRPVPPAQPPTETNQGNPLSQILQHRLGVRRLNVAPLGGGTAISGPNATLSPTSLLFRCRNVPNAGCQCLTQRTTTLSNLGNAPLSIKGITVTGAFSETNNCGTSLGAGKSCTIVVRWLLQNSGGSVYVSDNAPGSPQKVSLSGFKECTPR